MSANRFAATVTWLGGGEWPELSERHHRSNGVVAGIVVLVTAVLATLVATAVLVASTGWPTGAVVPVGLTFGVLVSAMGRAIASGPKPRWSGVLARAIVAMITGAVVGELAAMAIFAGSIDARLDERASRDADAAPAVVSASAAVNQTRSARAALDDAVSNASQRRDDALVVARCEFNPSPACPQTRITGVPGAGPENRTAKSFLTDTQRQLDAAVGERDRRAPQLDTQIAAQEQDQAQARAAAAADADRGLGARWSAMNAHSILSPAALVLRILTSCFFALLVLLPLILKLWRGQTTEDRSAIAREKCERAEMVADTSIAVKRAEVRAEIETLWAEQQLASARLAVEAQNEIDRETQRRRIAEALGAPMQLSVDSERIVEPIAELPAAEASDNLPALIEPLKPQERGLLPAIPDVAVAATRWIRPFVPPIIASAIETSTRPLRGSRQLYEESEEIHFSLRRSHRVAVMSEETGDESSHAIPVEASPATAVRADRPSRRPRSELHKSEERRELPSAGS